jgi:putative MATE family efflux protein
MSERQPVAARSGDPLDPEGGPAVPASSLAAAAAPAKPVPSSAGSDSYRELLRLAWPVMASQVLLNLTGVVDRMMIGRLADEGGAAVPLAAVGYATQLFHLIHSTLFAVGLACVALMARAIGGRDPERARHAFAGSIQVSFAVTLFYALFLFFGSEQALAWLGAQPDVVRVAAPYLELTVAASLMLSFTMIGESALRANRDTRTPMFIAIVVAAAKLGLNGVLIFGWLGAPRLELFGAGLATAISQAIGLALFLVVLLRAPEDAPTALRFRDVIRRNPITREIVRISIPGVAERIVLNFGLLSYFWVLSHYYGTLAVAAYTVGVTILSFSWIPGTGYAQACSTVVGQSLGARSSEGARRAARRSLVLAIATAIPLGVLCAWQRVALAELFTDDPAVVLALSPFMLCLAIAQPFLQMHFTLGGAHKGAGDTVTPLIGAAIGNWGIRVPVAVLLGGVLEMDVVWLWATLIFDHIARTIWMGVSFIRGKWREI